jgi:hypothetical protein
LLCHKNFFFIPPKERKGKEEEMMGRSGRSVEEVGNRRLERR